MKKILALLLAALLVLPGAALADETAAEEISLAELTAPYGFTLGAPLSFNNLRDPQYLNLVKQHFVSLTCTNETKAYSLLDQRACQRAEDGMPVMNYGAADQMLKFAQTNGIGVRGHVLVWDAYMPDWFFREGYQYNAPLVTREVMMARLESYIDQVMTHFETSFPGVIYCWDVVNEAIGDNAAEWDASDARHLRTIRSGVTNYFRDVIGNDYVELSFLYARNTAEKLGADIKLYYNDYNMFQLAKRNAALALAESINSYAVDADGNPRKLIDGVGMQGYIGGYGTQSGCMSDSDLVSIKQSVLAYADAGLDVQITEMSIRNYENTPDAVARHAAYYGKLFKLIIALNADQPRISNVSIWGMMNCDNLPASHYSYKLNGPYCGLFDLKCQPRDAFYAVVDALRGE